MNEKISKERKRKMKNSKGITLIALIITIVVLLILAIVTIGAVQDSGIIGHAQNAASDYKAKADEENTILEGYLATIEENIPGENPNQTLNDLELLKTYFIGKKYFTDEDGFVFENNNIISDAKESIEFMSEADIGYYIRYNNVIYKIVTKDGTYYIADDVEKVTSTKWLYIPNEDGEKTVTIIGCFDTESEEIVIPATIEENKIVYNVTSIDIEDIVLKDYKKVTVADGITTIVDMYAFDPKEGDLEIILPESVNKIEGYAFSEMSNLTSIKLPDSLTEIEGYTFAKAYRLSNIILPSNLKKIGEWAFHKTYSIEKLIIPQNVEFVANGAFHYWQSSQTIDISQADTSKWDINWKSDCNAVIIDN